MPINDLARTWREIGRIRIGQRAGGDGRPEKLTTFRLTSTSETAIRYAAGEYGGIPEPWRSPAGPAWEVVTEADALDVAIPPGDVFSQWWERWTAAGRERQCDGEYDRQGERPCRCPADIGERLAEAKEQRACRPVTRLAVVLPHLPDLGVWRLEVHGIIAARELAATMAAVEVATSKGTFVPGRLRLDQRRSRRPGEKPHDYGIPVLELPELRASRILAGGEPELAPQLETTDGLEELDEAAIMAPSADDTPGPSGEPPGEPPGRRRAQGAPAIPPSTAELGGQGGPTDVAPDPDATDRQAYVDAHGFGPEDLDPDSPTFLGPEPAWVVERQPSRTAAADMSLSIEERPIEPDAPSLGDPYRPDELEAKLAELHELAEEHHRTADEAELYLATEADLLADPDAVAHAPRRFWIRTMLKLRAGDYDPTPLERANAMASRMTEQAAAHDPRSRQAVPDPVEL